MGIVLGALILVQAATGTMIAFRRELNRALHASAMVVPPSGPASLQAVATAARALSPGGRLTRIDFPRRADEAYFARVNGPGDAVVLAALDGAGNVRRRGGLTAWPVELAFQIHSALFSGELGERLVGFTGVGLLLMTLIGVAVWWPGLARLRSGLRIEVSRDLQRSSRSLHRFGGALAAAWLLVLATTGALMAWEPWLKPLIPVRASARSAKAPKAPNTPCNAQSTLDVTVGAAQARLPGQLIKSVRFPGMPGRLVAVYFQSAGVSRPRATDYVWVDGCDGRLLGAKLAGEAEPRDDFFATLLPLHSGELLGIPGRLLGLLTALVTVGLGITGYVQWFSRNAKMRRVRQGGTRPRAPL